MSIPFDPAAIPGRHTICYRTRDGHRHYPTREVEVLATEAEVQQLVRDGYLMRPDLLPEAEVRRLRTALDETLVQEVDIEKGRQTFSGTFIRFLADKHPAFLELIDFPPALSLARALFGPAIGLRGLTARICQPDDGEQEIEWHFHQRVVPHPVPPMFHQPQVLDCLLYLDDTRDERNGPLVVIPGSHNWLERDLDWNDTSDYPGQITLGVPAGGAILMHGSLWHKALPTLPGGTIRRLLLLGYSPCWQKPSAFGKRPENGLTTQLLRGEHGDLSEEMRELLGTAGYM